MTTPTTSFEVRPLGGALGAEVFGVDLARLADSEWEELHALWLEFLVLFFPDQRLDADAHLALGCRLGTPEIHPFLDKLDDEHPEIIVIEGERGEADVFHTDVTFSRMPPMASILRMVSLPRSGGDTIFTNQQLAYTSLSAPMRELLDGLSAAHVVAPVGHREQRAVHPVVRVHPETGRKSLFVNRTFTSHIVEMRRAESDALLQYLYAWSEQPNFQCRYRWSEGGVGIWDNRATQHYALADYVEFRRIERVTIIGDEPHGPGLRWLPFSEQDAHSSYDGNNSDQRANAT